MAPNPRPRVLVVGSAARGKSRIVEALEAAGYEVERRSLDEAPGGISATVAVMNEADAIGFFNEFGTIPDDRFSVLAEQVRRDPHAFRRLYMQDVPGAYVEAERGIPGAEEAIARHVANETKRRSLTRLQRRIRRTLAKP